MTRLMNKVFRFFNRESQQFSYNRQWLKPVGRPVVFQIELTNHCPMTCEMCPRTHQMTRPLGFMEEVTYQRIIDEAVRTTSRVFLHHFGESLVHPKLGDFIRYASDHGIRSYLSANPVLLTEARIRALVDNGLHELVLSLDGVTSAISEAVRGRAAHDVELAEKRIHSLAEYRRQAGAKKPAIILQIVRQKQNVHEVEDWLRKWSESADVDRLKVKSFVTWDGREDRINRLRLDPEPNGSAVVCDKPWTSMTILWDGRVVPCCFDYDGILTLGIVGDQSLHDIWRGEKIQALRSCHRDQNLETVTLCSSCKDKEGYATRKWYYPFNRFLQKRTPLGDEWWPGAGNSPPALVQISSRRR